MSKTKKSSAYKSYIAEVKETSADSEKIINTEKGDFTVSEIMSMSQHVFKKIHSNEKFTWAVSEGVFHASIRKLFIRKQIIAEHQANIDKIVGAHFSGKKVLYVSNYNDTGDGPAVFSTNWDGTARICIEWPQYESVSYTKYQKVDGYYFFSVEQVCDYFLVFDEKGFKYLMWGKLSHDQKLAKQFIEFIGESFENLKIETRWNLSRLFAEILRGKFGKVEFSRISSDDSAADALVHTKNGLFECRASFSHFAYSHTMQEILEDWRR